MWGLRYRRWQTPSLSEKAESYCKPKDISVQRLIFFFFSFLAVQQFIELQVHLLTANRLQVHPVKANKLLVSWSFVLGSKVTKIAFPSADWLEHARTGSTFRIPLSCPSSLQWQLRPPRGKLINYGWMFDWQKLNDRSSVLTWLPHTENSVPIVFLKKKKKKTCQMIIGKVVFAQRGECSSHQKHLHAHVNDLLKDEARHNGGR